MSAPSPPLLRLAIATTTQLVLCYLALCLQMADGENAFGFFAIPWLLVFVSRKMIGGQGAAAYLWAASAGLAIDLASSDRVGLHFSLCAVLACLLISSGLFQSPWRWWQWPISAGLLAGGDSLISKVVYFWLREKSVTLGQASQAIAPAVSTAFTATLTVLMMMCLVEVACRLFRPTFGPPRPELQNQWPRLAEE